MLYLMKICQVFFFSFNWDLILGVGWGGVFRGRKRLEKEGSLHHNTINLMHCLVPDFIASSIEAHERCKSKHTEIQHYVVWPLMKEYLYRMKEHNQRLIFLNVYMYLMLVCKLYMVCVASITALHDKFTIEVFLVNKIIILHSYPLPFISHIQMNYTPREKNSDFKFHTFLHHLTCWI